MIYISTSGYINHAVLDGGWLFTFGEIVTLDERESVKDYVCDGVTEMMNNDTTRLHVYIHTRIFRKIFIKKYSLTKANRQF